MDDRRLGEQIVPYRGFKSFETEHAEFFFGRERIVQNICEALHQSNPLLIIGSSGSGKSSIIKAGLIPILKNDLWNIFPPIKPGSSLLEKLIETFDKFFVSEDDSKQLRKVIHSDQGDLCQIEKFFPDTKKHLLIIDQFEEVFTTLPKNERQHCIKLLAKILAKPPVRLKLLLAMRAEALEVCLQYSTLTQLVQTQTIYIPPLEESEWKQIIEEPAERADYIIQGGLQNEILKDVKP